MHEHSELKRLLDRVLAAPTAERGALLDELCAGDPPLRQRLDELVNTTRETPVPQHATDAQATVDSAESGPAVHHPTPARTPAGLREGPGTRIGPYKLLQQIGEGGFGVVFLAEQERPVQRRVALKIIKLGMDTHSVVARFEQERQALAIMDHPGIAKVFDAGATEAGRPFFVMELCVGEPISDYCDKHSLGIRQRLELFAQVCAAVQHAHTKGIIHRDLKPSNVLVSMQDGVPQAKVIDFGIAKATSARLTDRTLFTEHKQLIGTPEYMSPEQADGSLDIDTRTDVYALGVLLYELLTGSTPFDPHTLRSAAFTDIQRMIREVDPPKPSTRLSQNSGALPAVAARRGIEPRRLSTILRGELDWIVMKALEKDRARRYETANGLAMDVRRYLAGEPVLAAPPSAGYRFTKLIRRHRVTATAASVVAATLVVGVFAFAWQAQVARKQRDVAVAAQQAEAEQRRVAERERTEANVQRDRAVAAESEAKRRADELAKVSEFQANMLSQIDVPGAGVRLMADIRSMMAAGLVKSAVPDPERAVQADDFSRQLARVNATDAAAAMIDRTILQPAIGTIDAQFADQPVVAASLRQTLADAYLKLGLLDKADPLQQTCLATRRRLLGELHPDTLRSLNAAGILLQAQGKLADAEAAFRDVLGKRSQTLGPEDPETLESTDNLGIVLQAAGQLAEAETLHRATLEVRRRVLGPDSKGTFTSLNNLGMTLQLRGRIEEAEKCYRDATEVSRRVLGEDDSNTLTFTSNVGTILWTQGKLVEAEPYWQETLERRRRVLGEDHPDTIASINNMGTLRWAQGRTADAEAYFRECVDKCRRVLGEEHPSTLQMVNNLGSTLLIQKKLAEAEPYLRLTLEARRRTLGLDHQDTLTSMNNLGSLLRDRDQLEEADLLGAEAVAGARRALPADHWITGLFLGQHARTLLKQDRFPEAEQDALAGYAILVKTFGPAHERATTVGKLLASIYTAWNSAEPGHGYDTQAAEWLAKTESNAAPAEATKPSSGG